MEIQKRKINNNAKNFPGLRYLIDSDIIIEILKGNNQITDAFKMLDADDSNIYYSPVSRAEILAGAFEKEKDDINIFFNQMICLDLTDNIGEKAGDFLNKYRKSHNIGLGDAIIAATAYKYDLLLLTQNIKHYPMSEVMVVKP